MLRSCEDQLRFLLLRTAEDAAKPDGRRQAMSRFIARVDAYKYELKASLELIERRLPEAVTERAPAGSDGEVYSRAARFSFMAAGAYNSAMTVFGPVRAGTRRLLRTAEGQLRLSSAPGERSYPAIEALQSADDHVFSPIPFLADIFAGPRRYQQRFGELPAWWPTIHGVVARTDVHRGQVKYQFVFALARQLLEIFRLDRATLPPDWRFPWGSHEIAADVFAALATRSLYHLVAINFGAGRRGLVGCGVDQICLETTSEALAKDLARLTDRPVADVARVLDALVYGAGVRNPDPALQPLIPIGKGRILMPPFLILTSAWDRNMLSLHTRVDPSSFDAQSHGFEAQMVGRLADVAGPRWQAWPNRHLTTKPRREEIDLALADPDTRTLLVCEARWMIQPGDIREVLERQKVCQQKVAQAIRKRDAIRANLPVVLQSLDLGTTADWRVEALVIIDNFGGVPSPAPKDVPVVPRKIFEQALGLAPDLDRLQAAFTSPDWLPREGADFHKPYGVVDLGGVEIELPMFAMGAQAYMRDNLGDYLRAAYARTPEDLRRQPW